MSANVSKMIDDITTGPDQAFAVSQQPSYDDLLADAESAQAISAAMAHLYQQRSTAAATALYALLPKVEYAGPDSKATAPGHLATQTNLASRFGQRLSFATVSARLATAKKSALLAYKKPDTSQLHSAIAQFKAQRATGKSPLPQLTLAGYQNNLTQQLNGYLNGKSVAAIANQRDQLIAQARTQYAKDPTTANGIIALLNSEAAKRASTTNSVAGNPAMPGQPVPKLTAPVAIATQDRAAPSAALAIPSSQLRLSLRLIRLSIKRRRPPGARRHQHGRLKRRRLPRQRPVARQRPSVRRRQRALPLPSSQRQRRRRSSSTNPFSSNRPFRALRCPWVTKQ